MTEEKLSPSQIDPHQNFDSKNTNKLIIPILITVIILQTVLSGYLIYQNRQLINKLENQETTTVTENNPSPTSIPQPTVLQTSPTPTPINSNETVSLISTANWKDVNTNNLSLKIPPQTHLKKYSCVGNFDNCYHIFETDEETTYNAITVKTKTYHGGSRRQEAGFTQNYKINELQIGSQSALEAVLQCQISECTSSRNLIFIVGNHLVVVTDPLGSDLSTLATPVSDTIVSTITNSPTSPIESIPIYSTTGWQTISYQGATFQIPSQANFDNGTISLGPGHVITVQMVNRNSQTILDQFNSLSSYGDCNWLEKSAQFGTVTALQIAADGGACQGRAGGIVVEHSNRLYIFRTLYYDPDTRIIYRDPDLDTIVSTFKTSN